MAALSSSVWSSETLLAGVQNVVRQPDALLAKTEEDQALVDEFQALETITQVVFEIIT